MAGSITNGDQSPQHVGQSPSYQYDVILVADAAGSVAAEPVQVHPGYLVAVDTIPDGAAAPNDAYTLQLLTEDGVDLLAGGGINRSATEAQRLLGKPSMVKDMIYPTLTAAGNGGTVRMLLWIQGC